MSTNIPMQCLHGKLLSVYWWIFLVMGCSMGTRDAGYDLAFISAVFAAAVLLEGTEITLPGTQGYKMKMKWTALVAGLISSDIQKA